MVWVTDFLLPFQKVLPVRYFPPDGDAIRILGQVSLDMFGWCPLDMFEIMYIIYLM